MMMCAGDRTKIGASVPVSGEARHHGSENSALKKIAESSFTTRRISDSASIERPQSTIPLPAVRQKRPARRRGDLNGFGLSGNKNGRADNNGAGSPPDTVCGG